MGKNRTNCSNEVGSLCTAISKIEINSLISLLGGELRKQGLTENTIKKYTYYYVNKFKQYCDSVQIMEYMPQVADEWLKLQYYRMENGKISSKYCQNIKKVISMCNELYNTGRIQKRIDRDNCRLCISPENEKIVAAFLRILEPLLGTSSIGNFKYYSRQFFYYVECNLSNNLKKITASDIQAFLSWEYPTHMNSIGNVINVLCRLLGFLYEKGYINFKVDFGLFKSAGNSKKVLPCLLGNEIDELIRNVDTATSTGKRDRAILVLAAYTGLRGVDIFNLKLNEINWNTSEIHIIQRKTGRALSLPLEATVGNAIADYILNGRPDSPLLYVFLRTKAPYTKLSDHGNGYNILFKHLKSVGFEWKPNTGRGFHSIRRSIGTRMAENGVPLPTIAEVLGHSSMESSKRYISFDAMNMVQCCLGLGSIPVTKGGLS